MTETRTATLHRMVLPEHICPFGVRAKAMLEQAGYEIDDHQMTSRAQVDAFEEQEGVKTTPVTFIGGTRYDTSEALEEFLANAPAD
ncbi:MAG: glutaredoxin [Sphingomicrobium sp.]